MRASVELSSASGASGREHDALLILNNLKLRVATLNPGPERIALMQPVGRKPRCAAGWPNAAPLPGRG